MAIAIPLSACAPNAANLTAREDADAVTSSEGARHSETKQSNQRGTVSANKAKSHTARGESEAGGEGDAGAVETPSLTHGIYTYKSTGEFVYGSTVTPIEDYRYLEVAPSEQGSWTYRAYDDREVRSWRVDVTGKDSKLLALSWENALITSNFVPSDLPVEMPARASPGDEWGYVLMSEDKCYRQSVARKMMEPTTNRFLNGVAWEISESSELVTVGDKTCPDVEIVAEREFVYTPRSQLVLDEHERAAGNVMGIPVRVDRNSKLIAGPNITQSGSD